MTVAAKTAFSAKFFMAPDGSTPVLVAEVKVVNPPVLERETIDVTTHDSPAGARQYITGGTYDPGEVTGQMMYIAGSAGDDAFLAALTGGGLQDCKIVLKAATGTEDLAFSGFVTSYGPDGMEVDGVQTASFALKVSGAITQSATV